jgi:hypothetical protein
MEQEGIDMLKVFIFIILLTPALKAQAKVCEVYGITDSPQKLACHFSEMDVALSCVSGQYYLNQSPVSVAFHMDVEDGPVPLVFKASDMQLTVLMEDAIKGELEVSKLQLSGICK